jgi:hypothetical protein
MKADSTTAATPQAEVCQLTEIGVTQRFCECGRPCRPRGTKCSACSQRAYRKGEAHASCLQRERDARDRQRREKRRGIGMVFDGRMSGHLRTVGLDVPFNTSRLIGWVESINLKKEESNA